MNKKLIIQKLAFITDEMNQQTQDWIKQDHKVDSLEIDAFLSNIRYLIEQSEILNNVLIQESELETRITAPAEPTQTQEIVAVTETPVIEQEEIIEQELTEELEEPFEPYIISNDSNSLTPEDKEIEKEEKPMSLNERIAAEIAFKEVQEQTELPQRIEPVSEIPTPQEEVFSKDDHKPSEVDETPLNERLKSEQESLLDRLKRTHEEKTLADHLKESTIKRDLSFSLNDRFFFINHLFEGNSALFSETLLQIAEMKEWEEVEYLLIQTTGEKYKWENKVEAKNKFIEILRERFNV